MHLAKKLNSFDTNTKISVINLLISSWWSSCFYTNTTEDGENRSIKNRRVVLKGIADGLHYSFAFAFLCVDLHSSPQAQSNWPETQYSQPPSRPSPLSNHRQHPQTWGQTSSISYKSLQNLWPCNVSQAWECFHHSHFLFWNCQRGPTQKWSSLLWPSSPRCRQRP